MSSNLEVYFCEKSKRAVQLVKPESIAPSCCHPKEKDAIIYQGHTLKLLLPNPADGTKEKHLPKAAFDGEKLIVKIGEIMHPMTSEHLIEWITIRYDNFVQHASFDHEETPQITFHIGSAKEVQIYSYCNLHGLWELNVKR